MASFLINYSDTMVNQVELPHYYGLEHSVCSVDEHARDEAIGAWGGGESKDVFVRGHVPIMSSRRVYMYRDRLKSVHQVW